MVTTVEELSRLYRRVAEFERRLAEARADVGSGDFRMGSSERTQMLKLLHCTLNAMKARGAELETQACDS